MMAVGATTHSASMVPLKLQTVRNPWMASWLRIHGASAGAIAAAAGLAFYTVIVVAATALALAISVAPSTTNIVVTSFCCRVLVLERSGCS